MPAHKIPYGISRTYDAENRLTTVKIGTLTIATFTYDGDGNRVKSFMGGTITYYVGNTFEWTGSTSTMIKYYYAGSQRVAMRQGSSAVYFLHGDHLGSASLSTDASGGKTADMRYYPYGERRSGGVFTDRRYTGQREEAGLGLYDYDPALGRFIQADTIVPSPANPQSLNRYSYVLNNPLKYTDPSGHCAAGDSECWALADQLYQQYGWSLTGLGSHGIWTVDQLRTLLAGALKIELWFARISGGDARGRMRAVLGGTHFSHAGIVGNVELPFNLVEPGSHTTRGSAVYFQQRGFTVDDVVHEVGHVLDNRLGPNIPFGAALLGGGPADDMSRLMGGDPATCGINRSNCPGYNPTDNNFPSDYAGNGPSEDFAESFMFSVLDPAVLFTKSSKRATFMMHLGRSLTTEVGEFQGSPYASFQRYGGIPSGGGSNASSMGSNNLFR